MNFLSHLYLSGTFDEYMVGNFIADFVKGKPGAEWSIPVRKGIELHRQIDSFTDRHPVVRISKKRLHPAYHKYSGVIVDMFYDHFLAAMWNDFSPLPLADFAGRVYALMNQYHSVLPLPVHQVLWHMQQNNWLVSYARLEGIKRALTGIAQRTTFQSNMELAVNDLVSDYALYRAEFLQFYPEIVRFVAGWKAQHVSAL